MVYGVTKDKEIGEVLEESDSLYENDLWSDSVDNRITR
jgi:hypothetical protein